MRSKFANGVGTAILVLAVIAACGGDEGSPGAEKQAFIDQVDPLCENAIQEANAIGDATDTAALEKQKNVWNGLSQEIRSKPLPAESEDLGMKFVAAVNNVSLAAEDAHQRSLANDQGGMQEALNTMANNKRVASEDAKKYGFSDCDDINQAAQEEEAEEEEEE